MKKMSYLCEYGSRLIEYDQGQESINVVLSDLSYFGTSIQKSLDHWSIDGSKNKDNISTSDQFINHLENSIFEGLELIKEMREEIFNLKDQLEKDDK